MPAVAAAAPAALVLDVRGDVSPAVGLFDELEPGAEITLAPGAMLLLEHYDSCEAAIIIGGTVVVGAEGLALDRAEVVERRRIHCADVISLAADHATAGVLLRSVQPVQRMGLAPSIVIAGDRTGIDRLTIERDGQEVATLQVHAGRVEWPEDVLFLSDGARYSFVLRGGPAEHRLDILASRDGPARVVLQPPD